MNLIILFTQTISNFRIFIFAAIMITIIMMTDCSTVSGQLASSPLDGQVSGDQTDEKTANAAKARAEKFLRDVADLAPPLSTKEPNLLQTWPRSEFTLNFNDSTNQIVKIPIEKGGTVVNDNQTHGLYDVPTWRVQFYNHQISVNILQKNNSVIEFRDTSLQAAITTEQPRSLVQCISLDIAITRAAAYLKVAGFDPRILSFDTADFIIAKRRNYGGYLIWKLYFKRILSDIPYLDQGVEVFLEAGEGRLLSISSRTDADSPLKVRVEVPVTSALKIMEQNLIQRGMRLTGTPEISLGITYSNAIDFTREYQRSTFSIRSRISWVVRAFASQNKERDHNIQICIDTLTGDTLSCSIDDFRGRSEPLSPSDKFLAILHSARQIEIQAISSNDASTEKPIILDAEKDVVRFYSGMSGLRRGYTGPNGKPMPFTPTHLLTVTQAGNKKTVFRCDTATYQLEPVNGKPEERIQAGAGLQTWLGSSLYDRLKKPGN